jgi:S1-C subfamily serine protease
MNNKSFIMNQFLNATKYLLSQLLFIICSISLALSQEIAITHSVIKKSLVYISAECQNDAGASYTSYGTGFLITPDGFFVTSHHIINELEENGKCARNNIVFSGVLGGYEGNKYRGKIFVAFEAHDVLIMKIDVDASGVNLPKLADSNYLRDFISKQPNIYFSGFQLECMDGNMPCRRVEPTYIFSSSASITSFSTPQSAIFWATSIKSNPGNSGSPVYTADGRVIGIVKGVNRNLQSTGYIVPISSVFNMVSSIPSYGQFKAGSPTLKTCRHSSHGIERYQNNFVVSRVSSWYGGGHSQERWCDTVVSNAKVEDPLARITVLGSSEASESRCLPFNCPQYQYKCTIRIENNPIFEERTSEYCQ